MIFRNETMKIFLGLKETCGRRRNLKGFLGKQQCLTTSYDIRCEISKVCTQGILVLLYILQATELKMNTEFGSKKPKWFPNISKHPHLLHKTATNICRQFFKLEHFSASELGDTT